MARALRPAFRSVVLLSVFVGLVLPSVYGDFEPPPPPKPQRRKAGESFPPLPLPATPLRRTEKKRQPAPPALIGKVRYGNPVQVTTDDGRQFTYLDWQGDRTDAYNLIDLANKLLGVKYRYVEIDLDQFSYTPGEVPILYLTGHQDFVLTTDQLEGLHAYLKDGGSLWGDACCGNKIFTDAFRREMKRLLPERPFRRVPLDHPLFDCFYKVRQVQVQEGTQPPRTADPELEMIALGCRAAVVLTRWDLSCGWARHSHPKAHRVLPEFANQIGLNMVSYALSHYQLGRFQSNQVVYYEEDEPTREELVFGQVVHGGDWDPAPSAVMSLLKYVAKNSTMEVQFKRAPVDLRKVDAFKYPFLYMTGHADFELTDTEVGCLRSYLKNGGALIADACCGRLEFDQAFRREMKRVLPDSPLKPLPAAHPLLTAAADIRKVKYTEYVQQNRPELDTPELEGIEQNGVICLVYSKYAFGSAWDGFERPYAKGYKSEDALRIGLNTMVYMLSH